MLRDAACFAAGHVGMADGVQERRFAVVDVSHDGDDRGRLTRSFSSSASSCSASSCSSLVLSSLSSSCTPSSLATSSIVGKSTTLLMLVTMPKIISFLMISCAVLPIFSLKILTVRFSVVMTAFSILTGVNTTGSLTFLFFSLRVPMRSSSRSCGINPLRMSVRLFIIFLSFGLGMILAAAVNASGPCRRGQIELGQRTRAAAAGRAPAAFWGFCLPRGIPLPVWPAPWALRAAA